MTRSKRPHIAAVLIAAASVAIAAERHRTARQLRRRLTRRDAHVAAEAYALGLLQAEGASHHTVQT